MDKQTLSNYGWLVIITLVLAIMLAFATPFGTYVGDGVVSIANGFVGTGSEAVNKDNIKTNSGKWDAKFDYTAFKEDGNEDNGDDDDDVVATPFDMAPGLYDASGNLIKTWDELINENEGAVIDNTLTHRWININNGGMIISDTEFSTNPPDDQDNFMPYPAFGYINDGSILVLDDSVTQIGSYSLFWCDLTSIVFKGVHFEDSWDYELSGLDNLYFTPSLNHFDGFNTFGNGLSIENVTMHFNGTVAECEAIMQNPGSWGQGTPIYTINCTDGICTNQ